MGVLVDITPLRISRDFRRLWVGQAVSSLGSMITSAALPYQLFHLTGSTFALGALGLVRLVPLLAFSFVGGAFADSVDKRKMLLAVNVAAMGCSLALAGNSLLAHPHVWVLYAIGATSSAISAMSFPVTRSLLPMLLSEELRPAAYAIQSIYFSLGAMVGPAVGGLLIGISVSTAYFVDVVTFAIALVAFFGLRPSPPPAGAARASRSSVLEGLRFARGHRVLLGVFGVDLLANVFGMPRALFPALAERLHGGPLLYGLLLSSVAVGAFIASVTSGWASRVQRQGLAVLVSAGAWGLAIAIAGLSRTPAIVLLMLAAAGAADMISGIYRSTVAADVTPDHLRGRVSGLEFAVYAGGPVLGDVESGVVGGFLGVPFAIVSGGIGCVLGALAFAGLVPSFARYRRPAPMSDDAPVVT